MASSASCLVSAAVISVSTTLPRAARADHERARFRPGNGEAADYTWLEAVIDTDITLAGLDIKATDLGVQYQSANDSFIISGSASFALEGNTVNIMLGGSFSQGLVIQGGRCKACRRRFRAISTCWASRSWPTT